MRSILVAAAALLSACAHEETPDTDAAAAQRATGLEIAQARCATCHAVGETGASPVAGAPLFRELHTRYRFDVLEEELREGVHVGDTRMPQFAFTIAETDALIAYLRTLQGFGGEAAP